MDCWLYFYLPSDGNTSQLEEQINYGGTKNKFVPKLTKICCLEIFAPI